MGSSSTPRTFGFYPLLGGDWTTAPLSTFRDKSAIDVQNSGTIFGGEDAIMNPPTLFDSDQ